MRLGFYVMWKGRTDTHLALLVLAAVQCIDERQRTERPRLLHLLYFRTFVNLRRATRVSLPRTHSSISTLCIGGIILVLACSARQTPFWPLPPVCATFRARSTWSCQVTVKQNTAQTWLSTLGTHQLHCFAQWLQKKKCQSHRVLLFMSFF